jgi:hypothetical protein
MKNFNYNNKLKKLILYFFSFLIYNFIYSQNDFSKFYQKSSQKELIFIKDNSLKKTLESVIIENNYCKNHNLVWYLKETNNQIIISLVIKNSILNDNLKYVTIINDFVVYTNEIEKFVNIKKSNIRINYEENEDIYFQDFSFWILIKENDDYKIKKEFISCD